MFSRNKASDKKFQHEHHGTAACSHLKQACAKPCGSNADYQCNSTCCRALRCLNDGRKGHHSQRYIGHIVQKRLDEAVFDRLADQRQRLTGNSTAAAPEIATVKRMVRVPSESAEMPGR